MGWQPEVHHGGVYRDLSRRGFDNSYRYEYPYRAGHYASNHDRDWWRPYYGYRAFHVAWPFWYPRWDSYYPVYRTSYYYTPSCYGYPYASYYGYPETGYYDYADAGYYGDSSSGYYDDTNAIYYGAGYPPANEAAAFYDAADSQPVAAAPVAEPSGAPGDAEAVGDASVGQRFFADALTAFQQKDYRQAARMANHAMIEIPQDARVHELLSLALFAMGDYRGATMEAHAALTQGTIGDWPRVYSYYQDQPTYAKQLSELEQYVKKNPTSLDARFVLGYHYLMLGYRAEAKKQLAPVVSKAPWDKVAVQLLKQAEGEATALPPPNPGSALPANPSPIPRTLPAGPAEF